MPSSLTDSSSVGETSTLLSPRQPPEAFRSVKFDTLVARVGQNSTAMASKTRKNTQEAATEHREGQNTLEAQLADLRAELATLRTNRQVQPVRPTETTPRVPRGLPKFKGKRGEDVRQWLFQVETLCRIHCHDGDNDNTTLQSIARTAMEDPASGWFLFWASRTPAEEQSWAQFTRDALAHFEASYYQAVLR
ncbi:unnamed protein product [Phytophthora fragariaefolia]|uniref:Unnamed protein product n=1 Tax=Phytophthora fragariaefolia TaxID=1490495 RepID=A0A9W6WW05_9STRA|nr:unnamed protein product [Phytophthora fragariaefolia]